MPIPEEAQVIGFANNDDFQELKVEEESCDFDDAALVEGQGFPEIDLPDAPPGKDKPAEKGSQVQRVEKKIAQLPNIPQFKVKWKMGHVGPIKTLLPHAFRRLAKVHVFARVEYPTSLSHAALSKCISAGLAAAGVAFLSGVGAPASIKAFMTAFTLCAGKEGHELASKLRVHIHTQTEHTAWKPI